MKTFLRNTLFFLLLTIANNNIAVCQATDAEKALQQANGLFTNGEVEQIPQILYPYIEKGFNRKQKKEAHILIVKSYLFDDLQQKARESLIKLFHDFPEYTPLPEDPKELQYIYELHKPFPVFSIGPCGGINFTSPAIESTYNVEGITTEKNSSAAIGNQFGLQMNGRIINNLDIRLDVLFNQSKYGFDQQINETLTSYTEKLTMLSIPLWLSPYYNINEHKIFLKLGGGLNTVLSSTGEIEIPNNKSSYSTSDIFVSNYFFGGGAGFSFKVPTGYISIEGSYLIGTGNVIKSENRDNVEEMATLYNFRIDDYSLNSLMFSISYTFNFYKVKK